MQLLNALASLSCLQPLRKSFIRAVQLLIALMSLSSLQHDDMCSIVVIPTPAPSMAWVGMHAVRSTARANVRSGPPPLALSCLRVL